jgi:hypothetical protein
MTTTSTANPDFLKIAQEHIAMGIPVMPVAAGQKAPPLICNGTKDATTNPEIVRQWWAQWPDANVAVVGKLERGGLLIVDDDEDVIGKAPLEINMLVNTRVVESSPGHRQYYFWHSPLSVAAGNLGQKAGFSVRSHNHYGMAAGSIHPDGHEYRLIVDAPIQTMPDELIVYLQELRSRAQNTVDDDTGDWTLPEGRKMRENEGRNEDMAAGAGLIWDGQIDLDDFVDRLTRWCNMRHDPPYPPERIHDVCVRFMTEYRDRPGPGLDYSYLLTKEEWDAAGVATFEKIVALADALSIFHSYNDYVNAPPLTMVIEKWLQADVVTLLGALAGHGKTWVMLQMVRSLLTGEPLFGYPPFKVNEKAERIVYLVPEVSIGPFKHRLEKTHLMPFVQERKLLTRTLSSPGEVRLGDAKLMAAVKGAHLFLDTAVRFMEGSEQDVGDAKMFSKALFDMQRAGARTVTGAHHSPKALESNNNMTLENVLRGSGDIGAMCATCWALWQQDKDTNRVLVQNVKPRDFEPPKPFEIEGRPHIDQTGLFKMVLEPGKSMGKAPNHDGGGRPSTIDPEMGEKIAHMVKDGVPYRDVGDALGISKDAVGRYVNAHHLKQKYGKG